jgi:DNA modification methylase
MDRFVNKVFYGDARILLRALPTASIDCCLADPMFGVATTFRYDWGLDPAEGDPDKHWQYHQPLYQDCLRVLRPGGILAWAQSFKFMPYFNGWFGPHRIWSPLWTAHGLNFIPNIWVVQTAEQQPVEHPNNMLLFVDRNEFVPIKKLHPCPKPVEEVAFLIEALTNPGDIVLDCFCGTGTTLVAAQQLGRQWIGCDLSPDYCRIAMKRLAGVPLTTPATDGGQVMLNKGRSDASGVAATVSPRRTPRSGDPVILSSHQCNNDFLMAQVARLYFRPGDRIADVTYGKGVFWRQIDVSQFHFHPSDLLTVPDHPYDFRNLPYRSADFDVVVFDPPYMHHPKHPKVSPLSMEYRNFATTRGFSHDDIIQLYRDGMVEGHRILKAGGLMLVKCKDEMEDGRQKMSHIEVYDIAVSELHMEVHDQFVLTQTRPPLHFGRLAHARKNHSYLWVFRKDAS